MSKGRGRAWGIAFLLTLPFATAVGVGESYLSRLQIAPTLTALLYGANLHLLIAILALLLARVIFWRSKADSFPVIGLGAWLTLEMGIVVPYWVSLAGFVPPFEQVAGKLGIAALMIAGALLAILATRLAVRAFGGERWDRTARGLSGLMGLLVALMLVTANGIVIARTWPRDAQHTQRIDAEARPRPDVFVILVDTLRRDHLSSFGYDRPTSPQIDELLSESDVFTNAYTPSNRTIPSVASLFSGLYPTSHGVSSHGTRLPDEAFTMAEHFRSFGYRTAAFVANRIVTAHNGFAQGFNHYFPPSPAWWTYQQRTAIERIAERFRLPPSAAKAWVINLHFLQWLDANRGHPRFAYLHYMEPHSPYEPAPQDLDAVAPNAPWGPATPPLFHQYRESDICSDWECLNDPPVVEESNLTGMIARYDGDIRLVDRRIGQLMSKLRDRGLLDSAHILFLSDHGEEFADHTGWFHGHSIYEEVTGCAMAYRPPGGAPNPKLLTRPVSQLDIARTLFSALKMEPPPLHQGVELPELLGDAAPPIQPRPVLAELPPSLYSLRLGSWKLIRRGPAELPQLRLYHLPSDTREQVDLAAVYPDTLALLAGYLEGMIGQLAQTSLERIDVTIDPETLERLRSLGYIQ